MLPKCNKRFSNISLNNAFTINKYGNRKDWGWEIGDWGWKMEDGRWRMEDEGFLIFDFWILIFPIIPIPYSLCPKKLSPPRGLGSDFLEARSYIGENHFFLRCVRSVRSGEKIFSTKDQKE